MMTDRLRSRFTVVGERIERFVMLRAAILRHFGAPQLSNFTNYYCNLSSLKIHRFRRQPRLSIVWRNCRVRYRTVLPGLDVLYCGKSNESATLNEIMTDNARAIARIRRVAVRILRR